MPAATNQPGPQVLSYSTSSNKVIPITAIFSTFIDGTDCGIVGCFIREAGCTITYTGTEITMDTDFKITIKRNVVDGHGPT